jgi:hypothetical protein
MCWPREHVPFSINWREVSIGAIVFVLILPDLKGKASDSAGKVIYSKELDANLVVLIPARYSLRRKSKQT